MVFGLTLGARTRKFVKKNLQKMCSKLIGVATNSFPNFLFRQLDFDYSNLDKILNSLYKIVIRDLSICPPASVVFNPAWNPVAGTILLGRWYFHYPLLNQVLHSFYKFGIINRSFGPPFRIIFNPAWNLVANSRRRAWTSTGGQS